MARHLHILSKPEEVKVVTAWLMRPTTQMSGSVRRCQSDLAPFTSAYVWKTDLGRGMFI